MDNLSSHKVEGVIEPIIAAGATVRYLPPYSPDLNPIEIDVVKNKGIPEKNESKNKGNIGTGVD